MTLTEQMTQLAQQAKRASRELAKLTTDQKNACLLVMAGAIERNAAAILEASAGSDRRLLSEPRDALVQRDSCGVWSYSSSCSRVSFWTAVTFRPGTLARAALS